MIYKEIKSNLFDVDMEYTFAHCISFDCEMGEGIAYEINKRYPQMKNVLLNRLSNHKVSAIGYNSFSDHRRIINLITKNKYWHKPSYDSLKRSLLECKELCIQYDIHKIAMPHIGCGLDKLKWKNVRKIIKEVFENTNIEILVCQL